MRCGAFRVPRNAKGIVRPWRNWILTFGLMILLCLAPGCGGDLGPTGGHRAQFLITLTSISPSTVMAGGPAFTLTVTGSNITAGVATLVWNGGQQLSSMQGGSNGSATFQINASMIANPGSISIAVVDGINNDQLSNALTLTVSPRGQTACALFGTYNFQITGFETNSKGFGKDVGAVMAIGAFGVDANGVVAGEENFSFYPFGAEEGAYTGTCTNSAIPNQGTLTFKFSGNIEDTLIYTFVLEQGGSGSPQGRLFEPSQATSFFGMISGSGVFRQIAPSTNLNGSYAFGLTGTDASANGSQISAVGTFTVNNGNITTGVADINDGGTVTANVALSGSVNSNSSDPFSPISITLSIGGQFLGFGVYVDSSGGGLALGQTNGGNGHNGLAGFVSPQANAGSYNNTSLNAPIVFSTWGAPSPLYSDAVFTAASDTTIGIASGFDSSAGTFDLLFDNVSSGVANLNQTITGATYSVASNGRATVSYTSGGNTLNYVYYLDNTNDGYILGLGNTAEFGLFQPQAAGPFSTSTISGSFAAGTFLSLTPASPNLATEITVNNGSIFASTPSGALSGTYTVAASGRGTATVNLPVLGGNDLVFYVIGPNSLVVMGSDSTTADAIAFMHF